MHLTNALQGQLHKLHSNVRLAATVDGTLPEDYAFIHTGARQLGVQFASSATEFSVFLYQCQPGVSHRHCAARGIFNNLEWLALLIDMWVEGNELTLINELFDELDLFTDFEEKTVAPQCEAGWTKVKNSIFDDTEFWRHPDWERRYIEMLHKARKHEAFKNYYPFTSHHCLRFGLSPSLAETWELDIYIVPAFVTLHGRFYVSYSAEQGEFFDGADEAIEFYAQKLTEIKPIKWK